ncbi:sensor histidine kinase [Polymorphospora rubra]|uniref:sensor histidine kinase n=1 Tax=Polymorphospora rubra TaxID=338584 RepID=UPI0033D1B166
MWRLRIGRLDLAVAVVFTTFGLFEEATAPHRLPLWGGRLAFATLLVLLRRRFPLATLLLDVVVIQVWWLPGDIENFRVWQALCLFIGLHTVGREIVFWGPGRSPGWRRAAAVVLVTDTVAVLIGQRTMTPSDVFASLLYPLGAYATGLLLQVQARRMAEHNAALSAARELRAREAVAQERARIARELHDMVAHSVTVMVLQAGAVRRRLDADQFAERDLLSGVEAAGREAVTELRRTLGLLRGDVTESRTPQPGLARLDELVEQVGEAGLTVRVTVAGEPRPLPPSLDLSAYRIVQEALTNVLKHAGPARVEVTLTYRVDGLDIVVVDDGGPAGGRPPRDPAPGHGLVGMRERVALFGGDLSAGARPGGGYRVRARLPRPPG